MTRYLSAALFAAVLSLVVGCQTLSQEAGCGEQGENYDTDLTGPDDQGEDLQQ